MKMHSHLSLLCAMVLVGGVATPTWGAISFSAPKKLKPQTVAITHYLDASNPDLRRALEIHNLLNEMPDIIDVIHTSNDLEKQKDLISKQMEAMTACNVSKIGDVFKNPQKVWGKMVDTYEGKRQVSNKNNESLVLTQSDRLNDSKASMLISRDIMLDVYKNPSKWGETNSGASFPLWQDQVVAYEKQWNDFYNRMNQAFGAPASGRPNVDEKTRQNSQKYETVLKAHKAYLQALQGKKKVAFNDLPPKAPDPLPEWKEIVYVDPDTKQVYPQMPDVWKDPAMRKALIEANPNGELAQVFEKGNTNVPTSSATVVSTSRLEQEYNMRLAVDSLEKGFASVDGTTNDMQKDFAQKLAAVGIHEENLNLANKGQYLKIQKKLKEEKKKAIAAAQRYIALLEKQDSEHPELVQKRQQLQSAKQSRLSENAQQALAQSDGIVQISQMSPAMQQKFVISALEKDSDALVRLTETNAMNVDQLIRERHASNKLIKESQKQMKTAYDSQVKVMPELTKCSLF